MKFLKFVSNHISWFIILFLVCTLAISYLRYKSKIDEMLDLIIKTQGSLTHVNGLYSQLTKKYDSSKDIETELRNRNYFITDSLNTEWQTKMNQLLRLIKSKDEKLKGTATLLVRYQKIADSLSNVEQTVIEDRTKIKFSSIFGSTTVEGYTLTNPPFAWLSMIREPIAINITVVEKEDKLHDIYAVLSDTSMKIERIDSKFIGFENRVTWMDRIRKVPRMSLGIADRGYITFGARFWRFEPRVDFFSNEIVKSVEFHILN